MNRINSQENAELDYLIIPSGGLGSRMKPVNPDLPKELLALGTGNIIDFAIDEGLSAGISTIIVILNKDKEIVRQYIEQKYQTLTATEFVFLYQKELLGEADAIDYAKDIVRRNAAAVIYPDNIYLPSPGALQILKSAYLTHRKDTIALTEVTHDLATTISNAGRVDITPIHGPLFTIRKFIPKSDGPFVPRFQGELKASGIYISGPCLFDFIEAARGEVKEGEFTDIYVRNLVLKKKGTIGCKLPGTIFDVGNPAGYQYCCDHVRTGRNSGQAS